MPFGHYVSISATGPGPTLWYKEDGTWTTDEGARHIFPQVQIAVRTAIVGLPKGYATKLNFEEVEIQSSFSEAEEEAAC